MALTPDDIEDIKQLLIANNGTLMTEIRKVLKKALKTELEPIKTQLTDLTEL